MKRTTKQRTAIEKALRGAGRPMSPQELLDAAEPDAPGLGIATVYRTLKLFVEEGVAVPVDLPGEAARYEHRDQAEHHHHHFRCDRCARVFDIGACIGGLDRMVPDGFTLRDHDITLFGLCDDCSDTG